MNKCRFLIGTTDSLPLRGCCWLLFCFGLVSVCCCCFGVHVCVSMCLWGGGGGVRACVGAFLSEFSLFCVSLS